MTGKGTYSIILRNINSILESGMTVTLRCNYTRENIMSFYDVLDDLAIYLKSEFGSRFNIILQQVWQDKTDLSEEAYRLEKAFLQKGYITNYNNIPHRERCYADKENSVVVNYDGNIFKCTAMNFTPELKEGILESNGDITYSGLYFRRMNSKFKDERCLKCKIFPICGGGCSQSLLGKTVKDPCIRGYCTTQKEKIIKKRIQSIIQNKNF